MKDDLLAGVSPAGLSYPEPAPDQPPPSPVFDEISKVCCDVAKFFENAEWVRNDWGNGHTHACAVGGIQAVTNQFHNGTPYERAFLDRVARRCGFAGFQHMVKWNDNEAGCKEDVIKRFKWGACRGVVP